MSDSEPLQVAFFNSLQQNTWTKAYYEGILEAAEKYNAEITQFDAAFDPQAQFRQIQDALAQAGKWDAFIVQPVDGASIVPAVEDAIAAGIPVAGTGGPIGPKSESVQPQVDGVVATAFAPAYRGGQFQGEAIVEACADLDPCNVAWLLGSAVYTYDTETLRGVKDVLAEHPNIKIVAETEGGFLADPAFAAMQDILQAHPDVNVVGSTGDQMILGAEKAIEDAGRTGDIALLGGGAGKIGVQAVRDGRWFGTCVTLPHTGGLDAASALFATIRGETVENPFVDEYDISPVGACLTQDEADQFQAEWAG